MTERVKLCQSGELTHDLFSFAEISVESARCTQWGNRRWETISTIFMLLMCFRGIASRSGLMRGSNNAARIKLSQNLTVTNQFGNSKRDVSLDWLGC